MKNLFLASAAMLALGTGVALADGNANGSAPPAQVQQRAEQWTQSNSGIYVANTPRHQVWVYGAMQGQGFVQGGEQ